MLHFFFFFRYCSIEDILAESDSDLSEDEGKGRNAQKKTGKQQKGRAWLKEGEEDDPLNFLDPKVSQRVLGKIVVIGGGFVSYFASLRSLCCLSATKPQPKKVAKGDHGFKVTSDGRLIIREEEEEEAKDKGKR